MSGSNGVIRIGKKGLRKFAFGEEGEPFEVDVVVAWQQWVEVDDSFRVNPDGTDKPGREITLSDMPAYHAAAVQFAAQLATASKAPSEYAPTITTAEALDFVARLRECYNDLVDFFQPRKRGGEGSPATSGVGLEFSEEES